MENGIVSKGLNEQIVIGKFPMSDFSQQATDITLLKTNVEPSTNSLVSEVSP